MNILWFVAFIAAGLVVGGWIGIRWAETSSRIDADIASLLPDDLDAERWRWGR